MHACPIGMDKASETTKPLLHQSNYTKEKRPIYGRASKQSSLST
jgi:hypothetical protein